MNKLLLSLIFVCLNSNLFSIGVKTLDTTLTGTDKARFIENTWTFTSGDDYAKGTITFAGGIELMSSGSTYTVDIGVSGKVCTPITLNGNTLRLTNDMQLCSLVIVNGPGWIDLNGKSFTVDNLLLFQANVVHMFSSVSNGIFQGKGSNSLVSGGPLLLGTTATFANAINFFGLTFLITSATDFQTRSSAFYIWKNVEFIISNGTTLDFRGGNSILSSGFLKFTGSGSTINRIPGTQVFDHLSGSGFYEIGNGVTYKTAESTFTTGSADNRFILDNATYIANGVNTLFNGPLVFEVKGNSKIGSAIGGTVQFQNTTDLKIFPGSTLTVDENALIKLGTP